MALVAGDPLGGSSIGGALDEVAGSADPGGISTALVSSPPPIRRDEEAAAVTGELLSADMPNVPDFGAAVTTKRRRRGSLGRGSRSAKVTTKASGGTVATFPPKAAPSWQDPTTTIVDRDPLNQPFEDFRPVEIGPEPTGNPVDELVEPDSLDEVVEPDSLDEVVPEPDRFDGVVAEPDLRFVTETSQLPASLPATDPTDPAALLSDVEEPTPIDLDSEHLFAVETTDAIPYIADADLGAEIPAVPTSGRHFSEVTSQLPMSPAAEADLESDAETLQPPSLIEETAQPIIEPAVEVAAEPAVEVAVEPVVEVAVEPVVEVTAEPNAEDKELDALLADLAAVSEDRSVVAERAPTALPPLKQPRPAAQAPPPAPPVPPAQTPPAGLSDGFAELLRPPSLVSPDETTIVEGLPSAPIETPVEHHSPQPPSALTAPAPEITAPAQAIETSEIEMGNFAAGVGSRRPTAPPGPPVTPPEPEFEPEPVQTPAPTLFDPQPEPSPAPGDKVGAEVFGSETSVFPAIRTRRGDIVEPEQSEGSWFTRSTELPSIRVEEADQVEVKRGLWRVVRRPLIALIVLAIAAGAVIVALQPFGPIPVLDNWTLDLNGS